MANHSAQAVDWRACYRPRVRTEAHLSVEDVALSWLERQAKLGRSMRDPRSAVRKHIVEAFPGMDIRDVTPDVIRAWLEALRTLPVPPRTKPYPARTLHRLRSYLSQVLFHAIELGALDRHPMADLPRGMLPPSRNVDPGRGAAEVLTGPQILALVRGPAPVDRRVFWGALLLAGLRFGEAAAVRGCDVTRAEPLDELRVARSWDCRERTMRPPKNGLPRRVPIHPLLRELLEEARHAWVLRFQRFPGPDDLLFPAHYGVQSPRFEQRLWHQTSALRWWHRDLAEVGIPIPSAGPHRMHGARHTFISHLMNAGVPDRIWQSITHIPPDMGTSHRPPDTYAHPLWSTLCAAVMQLDLPTLDPKEPAA